PDDPNTYLRRGEMFGRLDNPAAAFADFARAEAAAAGMPDRHLRDWMAAEINTARSEVLVRTDPAGTIVAADAALAFHRRTSGIVRVSELLVLRARALEARGEISAA